MAIDAFGPTSTTPAELPKWQVDKSVRDVTDPLDAVGNTTKARPKAMPLLRRTRRYGLFAAYTQELKAVGISAVFDLSDSKVLVGLLIAAYCHTCLLPLLCLGWQRGQSRGRRSAQAI